jgi:tRNA(Arg) A34 adenosine deaminase TadA
MTGFSERKRHLITATIFDRKGNILSVAQNSYQKTHPLQAKWASKCGEPYKVYLHAEIAALVKARGKGYKIKIERYNKHGEPMLAAPCPICLAAIKEAGIQLVEHTV